MKAIAFPTCLAAFAASLFLSACTFLPEPKDDPTRYYSLSLPAGLETSVPGNPKGLRIGLRPVEMPAYLKKNVLAVREGESEVRYNEYARWAESFDLGVTRLIRDCAEANPRMARVLTFPFPLDEERDFDVRIRVRRAEGLRQGARSEVGFAALIEIISPGAGAEVVQQKAFRASSIAWDGKDYASLAKGLSEAVRSLTEEIVSMLPEKKSAPAVATP